MINKHFCDNIFWQNNQFFANSGANFLFKSDESFTVFKKTENDSPF